MTNNQKQDAEQKVKDDDKYNKFTAAEKTQDKRFYRNGKRLKFFEVELIVAGMFFGVLFEEGTRIWIKDFSADRISPKVFHYIKEIGYCDENYGDYIDYMTDLKDLISSSNRTKKKITIAG